MIKDLPEEQTHSFNDGCGMPEHNTMNTKDWQEEFDEQFNDLFGNPELVQSKVEEEKQEIR